MILVPVFDTFRYEAKLISQDNGLKVVVFPDFREIEPLAFQPDVAESDIQRTCRVSLERAFRNRVEQGKLIPVPYESKIL